MIANLPLLFAGGNPVSLDKMSAQELETFITFMVHCSWGHDTVTVVQEPPWWPSDVPFRDPFVRPEYVPKDWTQRLRSLVKKCYSFHNSEFLLKFSEELAKNPPSSLKYVDNYNTTTSLYQKNSDRLLVTFRNENMLYDKKIEGSPRKCLLPRKQNTSSRSPDDGQIVDIYLCDTCDEAFDDSNEYQKHERLCSQRYEELQLENSESQPTTAEEMGQAKFFELFGLQKPSPIDSEKETASRVEETFQRILPTETSNGKRKRNVLFKRLANLPFSSLAGRRLYSKEFAQTESSGRQKDLIEKHCAAPPLSLEYPRWMDGKNPRMYPQKKSRRPDKHWCGTYSFHGQRGKLVLDLDSQLNYLKCKRKLSVRIVPLTAEEIDYHLSKKDPKVDPMEFVSVDSSTVHNLSDDIIDLCSEDENSDGDVVHVSENILPTIENVNENVDDKVDRMLCPVKLKTIMKNVSPQKLEPLQKYHDNFLNSQANSKQVILID